MLVGPEFAGVWTEMQAAAGVEHVVSLDGADVPGAAGLRRRPGRGLAGRAGPAAAGRRIALLHPLHVRHAGPAQGRGSAPPPDPVELHQHSGQLGLVRTGRVAGADAAVPCRRAVRLSDALALRRRAHHPGAGLRRGAVAAGDPGRALHGDPGRADAVPDVAGRARLRPGRLQRRALLHQRRRAAARAAGRSLAGAAAGGLPPGLRPDRGRPQLLQHDRRGVRSARPAPWASRSSTARCGWWTRPAGWTCP